MDTNSTKPIHPLSSPFSAVAKYLLVAFASLALAGGVEWGYVIPVFAAYKLKKYYTIVDEMDCY